MGVANFASISSALATIFQPLVKSQINRACVTTQMLSYQIGTGKNLQWDVEFGDPAPSGGSVLADGADVVTFNDDAVVPAVLQWGTYSEAISVTGKAMDAAMSTGNPDELADLFGEKFERAIRRLTKSINIDILTGAGATDQIEGLLGGHALATTGSYAGIDRGTYTQWKSNAVANGGVAQPLSFKLMREMRRKIYESSGEAPDLILCSPTVHEIYGSLFGDQRRYIQEVTLRGQKIVLDGGYKALEFDGIPVIEEVDMPNTGGGLGQMLFVNSGSAKVRQLPTRPTLANRSPGVVQLHGSPEEQMGKMSTKLFARINPLAVTGDAFKVQLILFPQVQVESPNTCGVISDIQIVA